MRVALNGLFLAFPASGTGQYLRDLVHALCTAAPEDEFVFISPRADSSAPAPVSVKPTQFRNENLAKLEFEQLTFPRAGRNGFALAHVPHFGSPLFPSRPTIVTIHDLIPMVLPMYRGSWRVRLYTYLAARSARRARAILADSDATARDVARLLHVPSSRIFTVHLAAASRFRPPAPDEILRVREKYGLPEKFVLYLGGFDVRKNVHRAIEAFAGVSRANAEQPAAEWSMVIAGKLPDKDSPFFPDPRRQVENAGVSTHVHFAGFIAEEDKPALYAAARVFMYPSRFEGFGLPPLEAMACGTPVIAANASSLPEVVGVDGILLDPDDARAWSEALRSLLTEDARWNELRARGLEQASKFSWETTARKTLEVYRAVV